MHLRTYPQALSATDGDWLCRPFVTPGGRLSVGLICKKIGRETVSLPKIILNVYGKLRVSRFFFKAFVTLFLKSSYQPSAFFGVLFSLTNYRKPRLPCVKGAVSAADWGIVFLQNQCLQSIQSLHIRESARVPDDFVQQIYIFSKLTYKWLSFPSRRSIIKSLEVRLPARLWHLVSGYLQGETLTIFYFASFSIFSMAFLSSSSVLHLSISSSTMRSMCYVCVAQASVASLPFQ